MRDRSSRLARALLVAGASVFIVVGAVFGANALTTPGRSGDPAVTSGTPAASSPAESAEPAEGTEPAEMTESGEAPDTTATDGTESDGQAPGDSDGSGSETDND